MIDQDFYDNMLCDIEFQSGQDEWQTWTSGWIFPTALDRIQQEMESEAQLGLKIAYRVTIYPDPDKEKST
jgi:hypothetical protein